MKEIPIGRSGLFAVVDDEDYELVSRCRWHIVRKPRGRTYAKRKVRTADGVLKMQYMHTFMTGWAEVDHKDHDGLNNRRSNLREATRQQNSANQRPRGGTSEFKGVYWDSWAKRWRAAIKVDYKKRYLGVFRDEIEAAHAYDRAALAAFGEFACINFPKASA